MPVCKTCKTPKDIGDFRKGRIECKACESRKRIERKNKQKLTDETYYIRQREYDNKRKKIKRASGDEFFDFKEKIRSCVKKSFSRKGYSKTSGTRKILGEDWEAVKSYLETKFQDNMSWDNYGKWHIDHIIPLASAGNDLKKMQELCHYTNLQPLWAIDNIKKG